MRIPFVPRGRDAILLAALALIAGAIVWAQSAPAVGVERTYPYPLEAVQQGLQRIGGFGGGKLPSVDGFVPETVAQVERYDRPYFQYRVHLRAVDASHTVVSVEAKISALYAEGVPYHAEYRALPSNGRLESDLLERLQEALTGSSGTSGSVLPESVAASRRAQFPTVGMTKAAAPGTATVGAPAPSPEVVAQQELDAVLAERQTVRAKTASLQAQLEELKTANHRPANGTKLASVKRSGTGVMSRKNFGGPVLFRAQAEDEFEVLQLESGWAQVRLSPDSTGYIQADDLLLPEGVKETVASVASPAASGSSAAPAADLGFSVSREDVTIFSGDWARLKGKKVLFVYAQPRGLLSDIASEDAKLGYAKRVFQSRFRTLLQSNTDVEGVVVVFLGSRGGVAAATLTDIRQWVEGALADEAFVNRCSLDPPAEFRRMRLN